MDNIGLTRRRNKSSTGWKKAAKVNCVVLVLISAILLGCVIAAASKVGGIQKALFFYAGDCDNGNVSRLNTVLHLLINVVSTLVLASSNFFMQVLNSPSREEVNVTHFKGSWVGIGVPSARNVFHVSKSKTLCWALLLASSVPIHLLFNSAIFETDHRESDFHLTIASEEFVNGGTFYPPGASLLPAGGGVLRRRISDTDFGSEINLTDYADRESDIVQNISATARNANQWERLETRECKQEYITCAGLKNHRSLVLIADKSGGWIRDQMWHFTNNQSEFWDKYVPSSQPNHLFFDAQCAMVAERTTGQPTQCSNDCMTALTGTLYHLYDPGSQYFCVEIDVPGWKYPFFNDVAEYNFNSSADYSSAAQPGAFDLSIEYCLAELLDRTCYIGLSPMLLMGVAICVIIKSCTAILATMLILRREQIPLVTPGDAISSFIERPDRTTAGLCTFGQGDVRRVLKDKHAFVSSGPRWWLPLQKRRASAIPISVWVTSYLLFVIAIIVCGSYFGLAYDSSRGLWGSFFESDQNVFFQKSYTFFEGVITANSLQLLLSLWYLAFNNLFTRLQMAREWALFSEDYHSLRVTDPQGEQYATYRLQLPYRYSLPLIAISIFLHWLLSNTIYIFISTGGYYGTSNFVSEGKADPSLPPNTTVAVGYSPYSLLVLLITSCVLIQVPVLLGLKKLPPNMVNVGNNSFALSAACHVSRLSHAVKRPEDSTESSSILDQGAIPDGIEMQRLNMACQLSQPSLASEPLIGYQDQNQERDQEDGGEQSSFQNLARSKVRWGIVQMPPEWYAEYAHEGVVVEHLSFGVREDNVRPPS
ncbi:hypothetical protein F5Y05DRAFT_380161 [Hypoxylon sp. FL0543]|nr:hypothetical protein F5Y05DRAFT_380161 [Hypoxylon sp. FL0543]